MSTTFGELTGLAETHLRAAARESKESGPDVNGQELVNAVADCVRAVDSLQRLGVSAEAPYPDTDKSWRLAAREFAASLTGARGSLEPQPAGRMSRPPRHVLRVRQVALLIGAAHDLLATHLTGDGRRSDVSPLISGVDGRRQVTVAAASLAKAVADVVSTIGPQDLDPGRRSDPATTQRHLLWGAGIVRTAASGSAPAPDYLHAVASMPVTRRPALRLGEPQDQLLEAILAGVARLHDAAMSDSGQGRVHHHHARSLHTVATAMTATHAICGQLLAQLSAAGSPIEGAFLPPAAAGQLADAARRQQAAFDAWLRVCDSWSGVKGLAETGRSAQLRLEASDMVTRLWDRVDGLEWISYPASSRTAEHSQGVCLLPISGLS